MIGRVTIVALLCVFGSASVLAAPLMEKCRRMKGNDRTKCMMDILDNQMVTQNSLSVVRLEHAEGSCLYRPRVDERAGNQTPSNNVAMILCGDGKEQRWRLHVNQKP